MIELESPKVEIIPTSCVVRAGSSLPTVASVIIAGHYLGTVIVKKVRTASAPDAPRGPGIAAGSKAAISHPGPTAGVALSLGENAHGY